MNRRSFLSSILAAGVAPAFVGSSILMPVRALALPSAGLILPDAVTVRCTLKQPQGFLVGLVAYGKTTYVNADLPALWHTNHEFRQAYALKLYAEQAHRVTKRQKQIADDVDANASSSPSRWMLERTETGFKRVKAPEHPGAFQQAPVKAVHVNGMLNRKPDEVGKIILLDHA
jgi:hypothetical protein